MATYSIYLNYQGQCEEAFDFYKSVFKTEYININRFKDMPQTDNIPTEFLEKIMHTTLPISENFYLMGSDSLEGMGPKMVQGNSMSILLNANSEEEANNLYAGLSEGGNIFMPLQKTFWNAYYASFEDKFGVNWQINFDLNQAK